MDQWVAPLGSKRNGRFNGHFPVQKARKMDPKRMTLKVLFLGFWGVQFSPLQNPSWQALFDEKLAFRSF